MKKARSAGGERRRLRGREDVQRVVRATDMGEEDEEGGKGRAYFTRFQAELTRPSQQRVGHVINIGLR